MSHPQHIRYGLGGTITVELESRPSNALGKVVTADGTALGTITGTVSTVSTVLNVAASAGTRSLSVSSNTGMAVGGTFYLTDDPEEALIRKVDGCNVYLRRRLLYDHVNAANVNGNRVSFTVNSAVANTRFWDGHLEVNIDGGSEVKYVAVECSDYPVDTLCTTQQLFDVEPALYRLLDDEDDADRLRDSAAQHVLARLAAMSPVLRARVYPGGQEFAHAVALAAMMHLYGRQAGQDAADLFTRYRDRLESELQRVAQTTPRDDDQDGVVEASEKVSGRSGRLVLG